MKSIDKEFKLNKFINKLISLKKNNLCIGFTNGCFDLLHQGHLYSISEAKKKCDYLIIGLNSDISVTSLKGVGRPVDNQANRILKLSKLDDVDAIIIFHEDTPIRLIKDIKPDVLFKGIDYKDKEIVGSKFIKENGGKIVLIDFLDGYSTSKLIKNSSH